MSNEASVLESPSTLSEVVPALSSSSRLRAVVIEDRAEIPGWVTDLTSFREWAVSDAFPTRGQFSFLQGDVWADLSMEEFLTHNRVKIAISLTLLPLIDERDLGQFVADRMLLTNEQANISTEPDGMFFFWETMKSGRLRMIERENKSIMELSGSPDMTLEIVSKTSVRKDTDLLRKLYHQAEVPEYWLVDVRSHTVRFEILQRKPTEYVATPTIEGWIRSEVFDRSFQLVSQTDPLGHPRYKLLAR
jgi:Uma2 family endonuclease